MDDRMYNLARNEHDKENYKKSFDLYTEGLENGDIRCAYGIALFYFYGYYVEENKNKANDIFNTYIPKIKVLAEQNDMISCCIIGYCYYNGFYLEKNAEKAISFFRKSADLGYVLAQYNLGIRYYNGEGVNKDLQEAFEWFKKSSEQGNASAQYNLGFCYYNGEGTNKDLQEAFEWYKKSAEQGNASAQYSLGFCYYNGEGTNKDLQKAFEWFKKSAEQGYAVAQYNLGICYKYGEGVIKSVDEAMLWLKKGFYNKQPYFDCAGSIGLIYETGVYVTQSYKNAFEWYKKGADNGSLICQTNLGEYYFVGKGVKQNFEKAWFWYNKALNGYEKNAKEDDLFSMEKVAIFYKNGYGCEINIEKANYWYKKYAEKVMSFAENCNVKMQKELGDLYRDGNGVEQSYQKAEYWYNKASKQGDISSKKELAIIYKYGLTGRIDIQKAFSLMEEAEDYCGIGKIYSYGYGVETDIDKAKSWYEKAKKRGTFDDCLETALFYIHNNIDNVIENIESNSFLQRIINNTNLASSIYLELGFYYLNNQNNKNIQKSNDFFRKSYLIAKKNGENLSYYYFYGHGTKKDYKKTLNLCLKKTDDGFYQSMIGDLYYYGLGVKRDYSESKKWYEKSANKGDVNARISLGKLYFLGEGCEVNYSKAIQYFELAKTFDLYGEAFYYLGNCYYHGLGVKSDWHKAKEYYEKAISRNYNCEYALEMVKIDLGEFRKLTKMEQYAKELINNKLVGEDLKKRISQDLKIDFGDTWNYLKSNAQINLITGMIIYVTFISMGEEFCAQLDFSAIIVNFAKALEMELAEYFYKGYIIYLKKKKISPSVFPEDACFIVVNKENGEEISRKYQNENEIKNFKLGGLKYIIDDKFESIPSLEIESETNYLSKGRSETYRKFKNFKGEYGLRTIDKHMENYANDLFSQEAFGYDSKENRKKDIVNYLIDLSNAVGEIAYQYRNPAAHGDILGIKKASACGDYLIKVRKLIYGFLSKIKDKYKDGYK